MTEHATFNGDAVAWVQALVSRGVVLSVQGKRLVFRPASAFGQMSAAERATLKEHKAAIVAIVRAGTHATAPPAAPQPSAPCPHCYQSPCVGEQHELYDVMHPLDEKRAFERRTALDFMLSDYDTVVLCHLLEHLRPGRRGR